MKFNTIKILTPGHFLIFGGKKVRTPVLFTNVKEEDFLLLKNQIRQQNLEYIVDDVKENDIDKKLDEKKTKIEELYPCLLYTSPSPRDS